LPFWPLSRVLILVFCSIGAALLVTSSGLWFLHLEIPATILQLMGVLPNHFPVWYHLCRMGVAVIEVAIAVWMGQIYRHYGIGPWEGRK